MSVSTALPTAYRILLAVVTPSNTTPHDKCTIYNHFTLTRAVVSSRPWHKHISPFNSWMHANFQAVGREECTEFLSFSHMFPPFSQHRSLVWACPSQKSLVDTIPSLRSRNLWGILAKRPKRLTYIPSFSRFKEQEKENKKFFCAGFCEVRVKHTVQARAAGIWISQNALMNCELCFFTRQRCNKQTVNHCCGWWRGIWGGWRKRRKVNQSWLNWPQS